MSSRRAALEGVELLGSMSWAAPPPAEECHVLGVLPNPLRAYVWLGARDALNTPLGMLRECRIEGDGRMHMVELATTPRVACVSTEEGSAAGIVCANPLNRAFPAKANLELSKLSDGGLSQQVHQALGETVCAVDWHGGEWVGVAVAGWSLLWRPKQRTIVQLEPSERWLSFHRPCLALSKDARWVVVSRNYPTLELYEVGHARTITPHSIKEPPTVLRANWLWTQALDVSNDGRSFLLSSFSQFGGPQGPDQVMWLDEESCVEYAVGSPLTASAMHANAGRFAIVSEARPNTVTVVQVETSGFLHDRQLDHPNHPTGLKWSADGTLLAAAGPSGMCIWRVG